MTARVNGAEWSRGSTGDMHWRFEEIISYISRSETLYPGDFIGSGTVGGGCGLELGAFLRRGDVVELEVERDRRAAQPRRLPGLTRSQRPCLHPDIARARRGLLAILALGARLRAC